MSGTKWVDPAPFEGARPRFPWWIWLPRWAKVVALPFVLAGFAVWLGVRLVLLGLRYPVAAGVVVVGLLARLKAIVLRSPAVEGVSGNH